ncbi:anti-repressor SinI family protein [Bacillus thermotolerans]|uniref:Sin domain-containing protein n=1 Tax=Bacillus thermotolerans TaxID=1221996 RepID=A0A0F5HYF8_BACTR|nr:anti-repressor SinI family protein [Bacillus thermotolerans]KKB33204.1 hypothetical protein QY96_00615 [Bacillus thermotolerans]KKB34394.1 hypothetical protein QY97_02467 [Bacillus thermotolerans]KKB38351.1 hypothetical protein QY95_02599 [Bacillus thermotolerans]
MVASTSEKELDKEWIDLIIEARDLRISIDQIKDFLKHSS